MKIRLNASNQQLNKFLMSIALSGKEKFARDAVLERLSIVLENASFWINSAKITIQSRNPFAKIISVNASFL